MVVGYKKEETLTPNQKLIAGVVSGITTRFITQPLDIVKVRTQLQAKDKSATWIGLSWRILKEEGFTTFWHGHSLGQLHSIMSVASQFHAYEISTKFVENYASQYTSPQFKKVLLFMCGIFAGCASATLVSPIEVIRVRQMVVKAQYGGVFQGAREVYRRGGILAFYEGLTASLMQMGPQVGITFAVFRFVQPLVLNYVAYMENPEQTDAEKKATETKQLLISSSIAGSTAGFVSKTATYPFDLAKRRLQIAVEPQARPQCEDTGDDTKARQMQYADELSIGHDPQVGTLPPVCESAGHQSQQENSQRFKKDNYPVTPDMSELKIELYQKLVIAQKAGLVCVDERGLFRLTTNLERLRQVPKPMLTLFWELYCDTMDPLPLRSRREPKPKVEKKDGSDSSLPSDIQSK
ncbi:mitochondrial thiamine pyrophosphate carrier-like isoform X2 [Cydia splendana]|uniref:mitochondrial thiamine pyrophosphate carrier-like isoform X2 n=1 Tax=Cydia splendana TaxID=1100963 RepID=UPI00300C28E1